MNVQALRFFLETVRYGSFTQAAAYLGVSQSYVSKVIQQLEAYLGDQLLVRTGRRLRLTESGQLLWERGPALLAQIEALEADIRQTQALKRGVLRLGIPPMINVLFTPVLKAFSQQYPHIQLRLHERPGPEIEELVAQGEVELGFSIYPIASHLSLNRLTVRSHEVWAVAQRHSFLPEQTTSLKLSQLAEVPLIGLSESFGLTRLVRRAFEQAGYTPRWVAQSSQWDWVRALASTGLGVAILPEPFLKQLHETDNSICLPLAPEQLRWEVVQLWQGDYLSLAAKAWLECCESQLGGKWLPDNLWE
ncbi:MAG TPA: LysR family transcriptional regulator [Candidatus Paenalcaligenes intestinipullorum]|uniref:LysR family transcriptional regulator n=1 Tax=Candidatus Paenalcaligenes intestinipullorum TaxID=2838718 RepID=A0A9D2U813_9BURK|nr:LysR family transcriptional regulator [Candidatus Paenalcaligenes intestinipullorum]